MKQQLPALLPIWYRLHRLRQDAKRGLAPRPSSSGWRKLAALFAQACILALTLCAQMPAANAAGIDDINRANQLYAAGHYAEADAAYTRILDSGINELFVSDVLADSVQLMRGYARFALGNLDGAAQDAEAAITQRRSSLTTDESGYALRAMIRLKKGDRHGAFAGDGAEE